MATYMAYNPFRSMGRSVLAIALAQDGGSLFSASTPLAHARNAVLPASPLSGSAGLATIATPPSDGPPSGLGVWDAPKEVILDVSASAGLSTRGQVKSPAAGKLGLYYTDFQWPAFGQFVAPPPGPQGREPLGNGLDAHAQLIAPRPRQHKNVLDEFDSDGVEFDIDPRQFVESLDLDDDSWSVARSDGSGSWSGSGRTSSPSSDVESYSHSPSPALNVHRHSPPSQTLALPNGSPPPDIETSTSLLRHHLSTLATNVHSPRTALHLFRRLSGHPASASHLGYLDHAAMLHLLSTPSTRVLPPEPAMTELRRIYELMKGRGWRVRAREYAALVGAWGRFGWSKAVERVWDEAQKVGEVDIWLFNAYLDSLARARTPSLPQVHSALTILGTLNLRPILATYNILIRAHSTAGDIPGAQRWFDRIRTDMAVDPNVVSRMNLMDGYARVGMGADAERVAREVAETKPRPAVEVVGQALKYAVMAYIKAEDLPSAQRIFEMARALSGRPDPVLHAMMVAAHSSIAGDVAGSEEVFERYPGKKDARMYEALITAYGNVAHIHSCWLVFRRLAADRAASLQSRGRYDSADVNGPHSSQARSVAARLLVPDSTWRTLVRAHLTPASCRAPFDTSDDATVPEHARMSHAIATLGQTLIRVGIPLAHRLTVYSEFSSRLARSGRPQLGEQVMMDAARLDGFEPTIFAVNDIVEAWVSASGEDGVARAVRLLRGLQDADRVVEGSGVGDMLRQQNTALYPTMRFPFCANSYTHNLVLRILAGRSYDLTLSYFRVIMNRGVVLGSYAFDALVQAAEKHVPEGIERRAAVASILEECRRGGVAPNWGRDVWLGGAWERAGMKWK